MTGQWEGGTVAHRDTDAQTDVFIPANLKEVICVSHLRVGGWLMRREG